MGKAAFDKKLETIQSLREPAEIRKALKDRNNFLVSKAAALVGTLALKELIPDLAAAFDRFMTDPVKSDLKCWAKNAIAKSLKDLEHDDAALFLRGLKHIQLEPSYGRPEDSAQTLRGTCAMALVACPLPRYEILMHLVDALASDPAKTVRMDVARAIAQIPGQDSLLLLRLKSQTEDQPEVIGQCFASLLDIDPNEQLPFVAGFLHRAGPLAMEAAAAIGECHQPGAAALLIENYQTNPSPEIRQAILLSLGASREKNSADFLLSIIRDGRQEQSINAIRALAAGRFREEYREHASRAVQLRQDSKLQQAFEKEFR